ncbi:MAG: 50S ribosomal protein L11 methyltransferase [Magnetococcales bacterium]|nr:50S ribosomal protein L11 methyltransferase [Magnetococcales bacterium]
MTWELRFCLESDRQSRVRERVSDFLLAGKATAVTIMDASAKGVLTPDTDFTDCQVVAYFLPDHDPLATELELRLFLFSLGVTRDPAPQWQRLADQDWQEGWKVGLGPQPVGQKFLVVPSWITPASDTSRLIIRLDPQMAFGSGSHATTQGCLIAMEERAATHPLGDFLDLGTGSGILAIGAALLHAGSVTATDPDPIAVTTSRDNYNRNWQNGFPEFFCLETDLLPRGRYHTVVANILAPVLLTMLTAQAKISTNEEPSLAHILVPGGFLILSGILVEQEELIVAACARAGLERIQTRHWDEWSVVTACKPQTPS